MHSNGPIDQVLNTMHGTIIGLKKYILQKLYKKGY